MSDVLVRRLFARFAELYGAQKVAAMWGDVTIDALSPVWAKALSVYDVKTIAEAVHALPHRDSAWPPTLPEFMALCREQIKPDAYRPALPVPNRTKAEIAAGREQMDRIKSLLRGAVKRVPA
jgi:hypothetical protein